MRMTVSTITTGRKYYECIGDRMEGKPTGFEKDYSYEAEPDNGTSDRDSTSGRKIILAR